MLKTENSSKSLVLIDFDGTITNKDSFLEFILFSNSTFKLVLNGAYAILFFLGYKLKLINANIAKEKIFTSFFKNISEKKLFELGEQFCAIHLKKILKKDAIEALKYHQQLGNTICVVTASPKYWVKPWCDKNNFLLICTEYKTELGKITGAYDGENCKGIVKVTKIKQLFNLEDFKEIFCYGDTKDDLPMLALGTKSFYKYFKQ